ncbi:hypothetical protein [Saccharopolyspora shandongensis]|uniref:hypothetical protein n=1 Tax=Saccharopolyspora shandongensis TaxID=418495 RepID=UPI0033E17CA8
MLGRTGDEIGAEVKGPTKSAQPLLTAATTTSEDLGAPVSRVFAHSGPMIAPNRLVAPGEVGRRCPGREKSTVDSDASREWVPRVFWEPARQCRLASTWRAPESSDDRQPLELGATHGETGGPEPNAEEQADAVGAS